MLRQLLDERPEMIPTTLEDRANVLADNILQGGYTKVQLVAIVTSFVRAVTNDHQLLVEDCQALIKLTAVDVVNKMGSKDPTVRDLDSIAKLLATLQSSSTPEGAI